MSGVVDINRIRRELIGIRLPNNKRSGGAPAGLFFDRAELNAILALYSRMVVSGVWRDYSLALTSLGAEFGVFRSSFERPAYRIVKLARATRDGRFVVVEHGRVVRRGHLIREVLEWLDQVQAKAPRLFVVTLDRPVERLFTRR